MGEFVIFNKSNKTYFGLGDKDGIRKYGFYKDSKDSVLIFKDIQSANFVAQILYDMKGYKSLEVQEV